MEEEKSEFIMLKLRSGDEIIAKRNGSKKGFLLLSRPLQLQRSTMLDPLTGEVKRNICIFRDWLEFTTELNCEIPNDFIVLESNPNPDLVKRYVRELEILDTPQKPVKKPKQQNQEPPFGSFDEMIRNLQKGQPTLPKNGAGMDDLLSKIMGGGLPPMVTATFSMPPEVFLNIVLNMPMFDDWGQEMTDDEDDLGEDDSDEEPPSQPKPQPPKGKTPKKPKGDDDSPPWNNRFGFPK